MRTSFFLFLCFFLSQLSVAQINNENQFIIGMDFSTEYLHSNASNSRFSQPIGIFGQVKFLQKFSAVSSISMSRTQYSYGYEIENISNSFLNFSIPSATIIDVNAFAYSLQNRSLSEKNITLEQMFNYHFQEKKLDCFIGLGAIYRAIIQQEVDSIYDVTGRNLSESNFLPSFNNELKEDRLGIVIAGGVEYAVFQNIIFSVQLGITGFAKFESFNSQELFFQVRPGSRPIFITSEPEINYNNIFAKFRLGYKF